MGVYWVPGSPVPGGFGFRFFSWLPCRLAARRAGFGFSVCSCFACLLAHIRSSPFAIRCCRHMHERLYFQPAARSPSHCPRAERPSTKAPERRHFFSAPAGWPSGFCFFLSCSCAWRLDFFTGCTCQEACLIAPGSLTDQHNPCEP